MSETGPERIVLVGFMAAGKSTVGAALARLIRWSFLDMDRCIEERMGRTVADLFKRHGEPAFREKESQVAREIVGLRNHVVAAGGGAFAHRDTRRVLRRKAVTIWLQCDLETILRRIGRGRGRPLASNRETMRRLLAEREPSYRLADRTVDTSRNSPEAAARLIAAAVFGKDAARPRGRRDR